MSIYVLNLSSASSIPSLPYSQESSGSNARSLYDSFIHRVRMTVNLLYILTGACNPCQTHHNPFQSNKRLNASQISTHPQHNKSITMNILLHCSSHHILYFVFKYPRVSWFTGYHGYYWVCVRVLGCCGHERVKR